jgi:hypothetical protein
VRTDDEGKGIVMRPEALRRTHPQSRRQRRAQTRHPPVQGRETQPQANGRGRRGLRRHPVVGAPEEIITQAGGDQPATRVTGPVARDKWLTASVEHDTATVITALVDGNAHHWTFHLQQEHRRVHQTARRTRDQPQLAG